MLYENSQASFAFRRRIVVYGWLAWVNTIVVTALAEDRWLQKMGSG